MSETIIADTIIDLIRHGEPVGGRAFRGHSIDDPLSEKGWQQMWNAVDIQRPWQQIMSSPMQRCLSFARALAEDENIAVDIDDRLKEVGFGSWEGLTPDQLKQNKLSEYTNFYKDPVNNRPPGAENLDQFITRTCDAFNDISQQHTGKHILLVAHAGVIRSIVAHSIQASAFGMYQIKIANAGISRIRVNNDKMTLEFINGSL